MRIQYELTDESRKIVRSEVAHLHAMTRDVCLAILFLGTCIVAAALVVKSVRVTHVRGG